jgi:hypothetical protein
LSGRMAKFHPNMAPEIGKRGGKALETIKPDGNYSNWDSMSSPSSSSSFTLQLYSLRVEFEYTDLRPCAVLYDPSLDENRLDGLGTGNMHRVGGNFRPTLGVVGKGRPRRARSLSPTRRGVGGRGRGNANGAPLGVRMGTRPTAEPAPPRFTPRHRTSNDPSMRHVRPQVNIRAKDDMVAPTSPGKSPGKVGQYVDLLGSEVG